jgi:hypothetical protein
MSAVKPVGRSDKPQATIFVHVARSHSCSNYLAMLVNRRAKEYFGNEQGVKEEQVLHPLLVLIGERVWRVQVDGQALDVNGCRGGAAQARQMETEW